MVRRKEYDFLTGLGRTSPPSCAKLFNDEPHEAVWWGRLIKAIPITPGKKLRMTIKWRQQDVVKSETGYRSHVGFWWGNAVRVWGGDITLPEGTFDWRDLQKEWTIPADKTYMDVTICSGSGTPEKPGISWFDDLKIYQDDKLIYSNDFSNWDPAIGTGVGAPIGGAIGYFLKEPLGPVVSEAVGAVLGGVLGGGVGLLTGLGIIPVPQIPIPALEAPLEGPGAPAQRGKYQITG